jgi:hypothetical protein
MREIRQSGSEGGARLTYVPTPIPCLDPTDQNIQNRPLILGFPTQSHTPSGWIVTGDVNPGFETLG